MKPVIISTFLLGCLLSIVAALKCYKCHERNSDTCKQEEEECSDGDRCITICEEFTLNRTFHSIAKGCASSMGMPCDSVPYGKLNKDVAFKVSAQCCDRDFCNGKFYEMPQENEPNGVMCPGCYDFGSLKGCVADRDVKCRGEDDKCITFAGRVEKPDNEVVDYSVSGCTSDVFCKMDITKMIGMKILDAKLFKCEDAKTKPSE